MKIFKNGIWSKLTAFVLCMVIISTFTVNVVAIAYDPVHNTSDLKFTTEKPELGFYINAAAKWELENIPELYFGTTAGEWTAMDILRGMYTGADYINDIPDDYFEKYIKVFEKEMIDTNGTPHKVKYTEYSRLMLALSSIGYDVNNVAPHYRSGAYNSEVVAESTEGATLYSYDIPLRFSVSNSTLYKQGINGPVWVLIAMNTGGFKFYTKDELQAGINGTNTEIKKKLAAFGVTSLEAESKTINATTGKTTGYKGIATEGKQIEYILDKQIIQSDGTVGGWALSGTSPDPDITGMALQALTPYYLSEERFNAAKNNAYYDSNLSMPYTYDDLKKAVENAIYVMSQKQLDNGGFTSWGTSNCESVAQIIVALTGLGIDPLAESISLSSIEKTCSFIKKGEEYDGVTTNNMIDNILTFWAKDSGKTFDVGGFKHVTMGTDGGGGAGTSVNAMATDQALYALIAYDRFLKGENKLYDMTDMMSGQYKEMSAKTFTLTYDMNGIGNKTTATYFPYEVKEVPSQDNTDEYTFAGWNTKADGTGISINAGDKLSMPSNDVTLYATWTLKSESDQRIKDVLSKINAIGTVDLESEAKISEARTAYNALSSVLKLLVTNYTALTDAETALSVLKSNKEAVDAVIAKINAIGTVNLGSEANISEARTAYDALSIELKALVTNYSVLTDAEATLAMQKVTPKEEKDDKTDPDNNSINNNPHTGDTGSTMMWLLLCVLSIFSIILSFLYKRKSSVK